MLRSLLPPMTARQGHRGDRLADARRSFAVGGGWLSLWFAPGFRAILDRIDAGLAFGTVEGHLPGGEVRTLGGQNPGPLAVVHIHDWRALIRLAVSGSVGWYVAWAKGEWSSPDPVPLFDLFMRNGESLGAAARSKGPWRWVNRAAHWLRRNSRAGSARNIHAHYDLGNDFYALWLDETMSYSSARFDGGAKTLDDAQRRKIDTIVDRLDVTSGAQVLEIGSGWGSLAAAIAAKGAKITGITLSEEQLSWARAHHSAPEFVLRDYRDVDERYDAIASVEMVEAVGEAYWPDYLDCIARCLKPGGRAAIQYIAINDALFDAYSRSADFIQSYVFPGGMLLSESRFRALAEARRLSWRDQVNFGLDYAETLKLWRERFDTVVADGQLPAGFDDRFVRLWRYYLMYCEGGFRGGGIHVAQVTLVKGQ